MSRFSFISHQRQFSANDGMADPGHESNTDSDFSDSDSGSDSFWLSDDSDSESEVSKEPGSKVLKISGDFGKQCPVLGQKRTRGRPAFRNLYPLAAIVQQVLNCHPGGADRNRSQTTNYTTLTLRELHRLTLINLKQYCKDFGLPEPPRYPGKKTIRRLGIAPNPRFRAAKHYTGLVPFRTAPRNNDATVWHEDFHVSAATVKFFCEMACFFDADCLFLSCDNKNKVRLGAPANPNPTRPRGMYLTYNRPSMPDHSFPTRNAHITPMGYMTVSRHHRVRHTSLQDVSGFK